MDEATFKTITTKIQNYRGLSRNCLRELEKEFPSISHDTLYSILANEYMKRMKINHNKSQTTIRKYYEYYQQSVQNGERPGIIVRISEIFNVCPCLIAKLILRKYFDDQGVNVTNINQYLRDTSTIPDMNLAYEIFLCTLYDNLYSPISETMRHSIGQQYEIKLHNEIVKSGLAFRNEEHLRKYGYDKTPDVKLDVPVAVDGFVINWIESKALFGSEQVHQEYVKNQYLSYWNRFGPGLVIYWFGYVETISGKTGRKFIIRDHLPTNIIQISSTSYGGGSGGGDI